MSSDSWNATAEFQKLCKKLIDKLPEVYEIEKRTLGNYDYGHSVGSKESFDHPDIASGWNCGVKICLTYSGERPTPFKMNPRQELQQQLLQKYTEFKMEPNDEAEFFMTCISEDNKVTVGDYKVTFVTPGRIRILSCQKTIMMEGTRCTLVQARRIPSLEDI
ncbi:hypothetical protein SLS60_000554 [Paraconiothyrium brasiliense]|uniref:Uncharacterized protein n=1 Tax=Paraconiothyrium brasiliense TaxID=300254 RepID=A0ABR3S7D7_9PLEO